MQLGADRRGGSLLRAASAAGAGRGTHVLVTGLRLQKPALASDMKMKLQVGPSGEGRLSRADGKLQLHDTAVTKIQPSNYSSLFTCQLFWLLLTNYQAIDRKC